MASRAVAAPGKAPPLHLRGIVLPDGDQTDLWLVGGVFTAVPPDGARTIAAGDWIVPGLVDAHCHVGLEASGAVLPPRAAEHALADRDAGVLLIRDCGSPLDTRFLHQRADLPQLVRAGRHIARPKRYLRNFAVEVEPDRLVAEVITQALRGDGWVKLVGDWIDRAVGDLAPLWPPDVATEAIAAAHELGARVTAHCFAEDSAAELVDAGIDCIEHGTGLSVDVLTTMAERGVVLVPTMIQVENFPKFAAAGETRFPQYAAHMRALHARRHETVGAALAAGVRIFAGTDAGGVNRHGLIASEIELLARIAGNELALGAASWDAREWLGHPGITPGAPADLVVYADDPRVCLDTLRRPALIVRNGRVVGGSAATA